MRDGYISSLAALLAHGNDELVLPWPHKLPQPVSELLGKMVAQRHEAAFAGTVLYIGGAVHRVVGQLPKRIEALSGKLGILVKWGYGGQLVKDQGMARSKPMNPGGVAACRPLTSLAILQKCVGGQSHPTYLFYIEGIRDHVRHPATPLLSLHLTTCLSLERLRRHVSSMLEDRILDHLICKYDAYKAEEILAADPRFNNTTALSTETVFIPLTEIAGRPSKAHDFLNDMGDAYLAAAFGYESKVVESLLALHRPR